jgi:hypothetical protein
MSTDWPHDPDGEDGSEGMRKYGIAVIAKKVDEEEDFPLDIASFLEEHGEDPVRINYESVVAVSDVFEHVDAETVDNKVAFNRAVGEALRAGGFWSYTSGV